jgi:hypothetical protein
MIINKKFWEELIHLLSLHKLTGNNLQLVVWLPWNINNPNRLLSMAHLTKLNLNNVKTIEGMGLKITASRSPCISLPPYQIS